MTRTVYQIPTPHLNADTCYLAPGRAGLKHPCVVWLWDRNTGGLNHGFKRASGVVERTVALRWAAAWETDDRLVAVLPCTELAPYTGPALPAV